MRLQNPISALTPTVDAAVLNVLAGADTSFTVPGVHRLIPEGHSESGVRKALGRLVTQGLVLEGTTGRTHSYRLNRGHLLAGPVISMVQAKSTLITAIREEIDKWPSSPLDARLFGSAARNEMRDDSDIDLFFALPDGAGEEDYPDRIADLAGKVSLWTGNDVRPLVYSGSEVGSDPLFKNIIADGIPLIDSCRWLETRLRESRVA